MEKFYKLTEVARLLQVSPLTVKRWIKEGKLKALHPQGTRLYRIPESSLREFVGVEWWEKLSGIGEAGTKTGDEARAHHR